MIELGIEGLTQEIRTIGLFNSKARNVIALSKLLIEEYESEVPCTREDLVNSLALEGKQQSSSKLLVQTRNICSRYSHSQGRQSHWTSER